MCLALASSMNAQNPIQLNIDHKLGTEAFAFAQEANQDGYVFELTRLQYYISNISITHDGGSVTAIENVWLLVNANGTGIFDLGTWDINQVETISFYVGVGQDVNHNDPAAWPSSSPLSPQNPSMHWGWASGYRFVAMEGNAGASAPSNLFEIHALGDNNYFQTQVNVASTMVSGTVHIPLNADYTEALNGIDLSAGLINHSTSGASVPLLQNFSTDVFTPGLVSGLEEFDYSSHMSISPNPSSEAARLNVNLPQGENYLITIADVTGKTVIEERLRSNNGGNILPTLSNGVYLVNLSANGTLLHSIRWVVE